MIIKGVRVELFNPEARVSAAMERGQKILDDKVLTDSNYYIPAAEWNLRDSGIMHSPIGRGEVIWQTPYARRLYYNPQYNFSKDKNPNARGLWFESAKSDKLQMWLRETERAVLGGL